MSEPVMRRTQSGLVARNLRTPALRVHSPLAKTLSLCSVLCALTFATAPLQVQAGEAATNYSVESAHATRTLLLDVVHAGKRMLVFGDRGHILYSDDSGKNWVQAKVPTRQMITAAYFVDDQKGWAVAHDSQILATTDGGATWTKQFEDLTREAPLLDIWFNDAQHGFAVGAYGALLETLDGGANWEDISDRMGNEDGYHLNAIVPVKDAGLMVVGEQGVIFRSPDWGQTWETLQGPYEGSLFGVAPTAESRTLLVYGLRGHVFRSTDFGDTWEQIVVHTPGNGPIEFGLSSSTLLADGSIIIVGHGGTVLKSTDNGKSFSLVNRLDRLSIASVAALDNGNLILVGQGGLHIATPTGAELGQQ